MVFLSELPRPHPLPNRFRLAIAMAAVFAGAAALVIVMPRSASVVAVLTLLGTLVLVPRPTHRDRGASQNEKAGSRAGVAAKLAILAFPIWFLVAVTWSPDPDILRSATYIAVVIVLLLVIAPRIGALPRHDCLFVVESAWIAFAAATAVVLIDALTQQTWKQSLLEGAGLALTDVFPERFIYRSPNGTAQSLSFAILTRNGFIIALLFWPMLLIARAILPVGKARIATVVLAGVTVVTVFVLPQEAAKLALIVGAVAFGLTWIAPKPALYFAGLTWISMCLFAAPIAHIPSQLGLDSDPRLHFSAQERAKIWGRIADQSNRAPILGEGPGATRFISQSGIIAYQTIRPDGSGQLSGPTVRVEPTHPHNAFLEIRFELGLIGALLAALAGVSGLAALRDVGRESMAYAIATVAGLCVILGLTYSMWSASYASALAFVVVALMYAIRTNETRPARTKQQAAS